MATQLILAKFIWAKNMESARSTGNFNRRITVADGNNIVVVVNMNALNSKYQIFEEDYLVEFQAVLEDLKITVGLLSLAEAPWPDTNALTSESETMAEIARIRTQGQKISLGLYVAEGNGPWKYESEVVLQNQGGSETHVPILVPFLSSNETLLVGGDFKLGVKVEPKWNQPLKANDYLVVKGTWRQIVSFSKKKDDDVDALNDRLSALETLLSVYGAPSASLPGSNGLVPAPPAGGGEFLLRGDRAWQNPNEFATPAQITAFASTMTNALAQKVGTIGNEIIAGLKTFADAVRITNTTQSTSTTTGAHIIAGGQAVGGNLNVGGFTSLGDNVAIKVKRLTGITAATQGGNVSIAHGLTGDKIIGWTIKINYATNYGMTEGQKIYNGYEAYSYLESTVFNITNSGANSSGILSKPFTVIVFYVA